MDTALPTLALETFAVSKQFKTVKALHQVSLQVPEGSIFGFLGPNGSGKSTLIRVLTGLISPSEGHFNIFSESSSRGYRVRRHISAMVDRADFYKNLSANRNLHILGRLTGHAQQDHIDYLLQLVGLYERRHDKVKTYSQGMKQRLGLAQALLPRPRALILDEPTTGLDPLGMREVRNFILRIAEEERVTIFLSSHLLHEVEDICTDIALIFNGRLAAQGPLDIIFRNLDQVQVSLETTAGERLGSFLEKSELVSDIQSTSRGYRLKVAYADIPELITSISAADIPLFSVAQRNRLEEFFLNQAETDQA